jgi:hypothetical protein
VNDNMMTVLPESADGPGDDDNDGHYRGILGAGKLRPEQRRERGLKTRRELSEPRATIEGGKG